MLQADFSIANHLQLYMTIDYSIFYCCYEQPWVFVLSLLGLTPLAERVSFITE